MQQCISVDAPVERLHNACGADFSVRTGQIAEDVKPIKHDYKIAVHEPLAQTCIPYQVVGVHTSVVIPPAAVHCQIRGYLEIKWQVNLCRNTVVKVIGVENIYILIFVVRIQIVEITLQPEVVFRRRTIIQS